MVTNSATQTKPLLRSAHSSVEMLSASRMRKPPMVGVPRLVSRWLSGPSARIGWPPFWRARSSRISAGPTKKLSSSAVSTAPPERKVM